MQRQLGTFTRIERSILETALCLLDAGTVEFHGFGMAQEIKDRENARLLTGRGTIYKALRRLEQQGFLECHWEDPSIATEKNRPRRKLYRITAVGTAALSNPAIVKHQQSLKLRVVN